MNLNLLFVRVSGNFSEILSRFEEFRYLLEIFCPGWVTSPPYGYDAQILHSYWRLFQKNVYKFSVVYVCYPIAYGQEYMYWLEIFSFANGK